MKYLSVCSGIEAATVAWHPLGWEPVAFSEVAPFPSAVLAHHYPDVPNLGDMTRIQDSEVFRGAAIDLLCGGTPCQSFSVAGLRKGLADPRGNLALHFLSLVDAARPRWVVWENVPGVLSSWSGPQAPGDLEPGQRWESEETSDFGCFLAGLGELGYGWAYRVLDAQYFGLAQRRQRVFVVAHLGSRARAAAVLLERNGLSGNPPPSRQARQDVAGTLTSGLGVRGRAGADEAAAGQLIAHTLRGTGFDASEDGTGRGTPLIVFDPTQITNPDNRSNPKPGDPCHTLPAHGHPPVLAYGISPDCFDRSGEGAGGTSGERSGLRVDAELAYALRAKRPGGVADQRGVRKLMPIECERLQGFKDNYTLIPYRGKPAADGPRYEAIGNSWPVHTVTWIGKRIHMVDQLSKDGPSGIPE